MNAFEKFSAMAGRWDGEPPVVMSSSFDDLPGVAQEGARRTSELNARLRTGNTRDQGVIVQFSSLKRTWTFCEHLCDATPFLHAVMNESLAMWARELQGARALLDKHDGRPAPGCGMFRKGKSRETGIN